MLMLEVMEKYGWDWYTYQNQPIWVLDLAHKKLSIEAKLRANAEEDAKNSSGR